MEPKITPSYSLSDIMDALSLAPTQRPPSSHALNAIGHLGILSSVGQGAAYDLGLVGIGSLLGHNNPPPTASYKWYYVRPRFTQFLANLRVPDKHREAGLQKFNNVVGSLNRHYYDHSCGTSNGIVIGSWGKLTQITPPRDVDALFLLPDHVFHRYQLRVGNRQSQLLQEVKDALLTTNPRTAMRADRHVVVVPFDAVTVEASVGFRCTDGSIIVCDSKGQGSYVASTALAEAADLEASDRACNGNTRALIRMIKCWQDNCGVSLKSFMIERLAQAFLAQWRHRLEGPFYYDWMMRDFFGYLVSLRGGWVAMPGGEIILLGDDWLTRAQTAYRNAFNACQNEHENYQWLAGEDWQKIFGSKMPQGVL